MHAVTEVQQSQKEISSKLADIHGRLTAVEASSCIIEQVKHDISRLQSENALLKARLFELEDRSRRDNLIFHGIPDGVSESWSQSETKLLALIQDDLGVQITSDVIQRSHRIGAYVDGKTRPIIAKFSSFKVRDLVLQAGQKLRPKKLAVSEDFCASTRFARKKLIEYGKACNTSFKLRYNRLYVNNKCFFYDVNTGCVQEGTVSGSAVLGGSPIVARRSLEASTSKRLDGQFIDSGNLQLSQSSSLHPVSQCPDLPTTAVCSESLPLSSSATRTSANK